MADTEAITTERTERVVEKIGDEVVRLMTGVSTMKDNKPEDARQPFKNLVLRGDKFNEDFFALKQQFWPAPAKGEEPKKADEDIFEQRNDLEGGGAP